MGLPGGIDDTGNGHIVWHLNLDTPEIEAYDDSLGYKLVSYCKYQSLYQIPLVYYCMGSRSKHAECKMLHHIREDLLSAGTSLYLLGQRVVVRYILS